MAGLDSEARRKLEARAERMEIDARRPADEVAKLRGGRGPWRRTQTTREGCRWRAASPFPKRTIGW